MYQTKKNLNYIFLVFFCSIWFCIDTNFENILSIFSGLNFKKTLLFFRSAFPFLLFLSVSFLFLKDKNIFNIITNNKLINYIIYLLLVYFTIQLISHYLAKNNLNFTYYFYLSFFLLFYFMYASKNNLLEVSFFISILFLTLVTVLFGFLSLKHFLFSSNLNLYGTFPHVYESMLTLSTNVIRSSGLARSALILLIPLFLYLLVNPINKKNFSILFILSFLIYLSQSRLVTIYFLGFIFFSLIFFLREESKKQIIIKIVFLILMPFFLTGFFVSLKNEILTQKYTSLILFEVSKLNNYLRNETNDESGNNKEELSSKYTDPFIRNVDPSTFSSGRVKIWSDIIKKNERIYFGNGFLGDRYLTDKNASNILYYVYASGGIISVFIISLIILRCFYVTLNLVFIQNVKLKRGNIILISSIFYLGFLIFRGIGENSFSIFSIDLIIFLQSLLICEKFLYILKN